MLGKVYILFHFNIILKIEGEGILESSMQKDNIKMK